MKKIILRIFWTHRRSFVIAFQACLVVFAFVASFLIRFDFGTPHNYVIAFYLNLPIFVAVQLLIFGYYHLYAGMWRLVSALDIWIITKANVFAMLICLLIDLLLGQYGFPRSIFIIDGLLSISLMSGVRIMTRLFREGLLFNEGTDHNTKRILVVGAGGAGAQILGEYRKHPDNGRIIGFIDDEPLKVHEYIQGVKILGRRQDIPRIVEEYEADEIILAVPSASGQDMRDILSYCEQTKAKIRVVPGLIGIMSGELEVKARDVHPDDLLGRETVTINTDDIKHYIEGRVVLVTGAGGSIGSEICRQLATFGPKQLILLDCYENYLYFLLLELKQKYPDLAVCPVIGNVRDLGLLKYVFRKWRPKVVFHAAAHKHVPLMEDCPVAAVKNNVFGTRNLIYASNHYGVERFVLISTDKAVNPINNMGMSKRVAEMILQARAARSKTKFMAVRFGNVLGSAGSVVPLFKMQIEAGGPVTVTHPDVKRYFMSIKEAVMLVLQAGSLGKGGELFILDMGDQIKVLEIAKNLIALSGLRLGKDIEIKFTGLRPGEKMGEELLLDKEKDGVTNHNKIFVSHCGETFDRAVLYRDLHQLHHMTRAMDEAGVLRLVKEIIAAGNK